VSIGYPGPVLCGRPIAEPYNLGSGWVGFDFAAAFSCPVRVINDAAMQAMGSYKGGKMLFLGLRTGLGSAMIVEGIVEPMELGHLTCCGGSAGNVLNKRRQCPLYPRKRTSADLSEMSANDPKRTLMRS
jgi:polyphosphate glucokinase